MNTQIEKGRSLLMKYILHIAHPHRKILLRSIVDQPNVPITYAALGKLDMIYEKLNMFLQQENITLDLNQKKVLDESKIFLENPTTKDINLNEWKLLLGK